jgi:hypothetical protein
MDRALPVSVDFINVLCHILYVNVYLVGVIMDNEPVGAVVDEKSDGLAALSENPSTAAGRLYVLSLYRAIEEPHIDNSQLADVLLGATSPLDPASTIEVQCTAGAVKVVAGVSLDIVVKLQDDESTGQIALNLLGHLIDNAKASELDRMKRMIDAVRSAAKKEGTSTENADKLLEKIDIRANAIEKGIPSPPDSNRGAKKPVLTR